MHKEDLEQMEKYWEKYHKSIPDYPLLERKELIKQRKLDTILSVVFVILIVLLFVSVGMLTYLMRGGL